jgi:O-antigen/teichoic acid export membrane protein
MTQPEDDGSAIRARLSGGFLFIKNAFIVIGAQGIIALMGLIAVPVLVDRLGANKFGIIALAWVVIGYASVLDLGLGRALTKVTADRLGAGKPEEIPKLFWTAAALLSVMGIVVGGIVVALSGPLTSSVLDVPADLTGQAQTTFALLGCTIPFVLLSTAFAGSLEARQRFDLTNGLAIPLSFLSYFGPVALSFFTTSLPIVISAVCLSRVCATVIYFGLCLRVDSSLRHERTPRRALVGTLLSYGGWVTVAAVVVGAMLAIDRFVIGAILGTKSVAFYATPFEASQQLLLISGAFANVLFPGFAANVGRDRGRTESLFSRGARGTIIGLFPLALICSVLSFEILDLWINHSFAVRGGPVLEILSAGVLINGLAFVAFALIQSTRPDIIAKVALVEIVIYVGGLWALLKLDGIEGAAFAFSLRALFDTAALYYFTHRLGLVRGESILKVVRMAIPCVVLIALGAVLPNTVTRIAYLIVVILGFLPIAWFRIIEPNERERLTERLRELREAARLRFKNSAPGAA